MKKILYAVLTLLFFYIIIPNIDYNVNKNLAVADTLRQVGSFYDTLRLSATSHINKIVLSWDSSEVPPYSKLWLERKSITTGDYSLIDSVLRTSGTFVDSLPDVTNDSGYSYIGYFKDINNIQRFTDTANGIVLSGVEGNVYYVDRDATGNGSGLNWANAANTLSDLNWANISDGDTVFISGGTDSTTYSATYLSDLVYNSDVVITKGQESGHNGDVWFVNTDSTSNYTMRIDDSKHLKFTGLKFYYHTDEWDTSSTNQIWITVASHNMTIDNCYLETPGDANGIVGWSDTVVTITNNEIWNTPNTTHQDQDNINLLSNSIGPYIITGNTCLSYPQSAAASPHKDNIQISDQTPSWHINTIANNFCYMYAPGNVIANSSMYCTTGSTYPHYKIYNNIIYVKTAQPIAGISVSDEGDTVASKRPRLTCVGNTVTVDVTGQSSGTSSVYYINNTDSLTFENNIGKLIGAYSTDPAIVVIGFLPITKYVNPIMDYNYYNNTAQSTILYSSGGSNYTLSGWQAAYPSLEQNSYSGTITFSNQGDTTITSYSTYQGRDVGTDLSSYYTTDILDSVRNNGNYDIGALESTDSINIIPTATGDWDTDVSSYWSGVDNCTATFNSDSLTGIVTSTGGTFWRFSKYYVTLDVGRTYRFEFDAKSATLTDQFSTIYGNVTWISNPALKTTWQHYIGTTVATGSDQLPYLDIETDRTGETYEIDNIRVAEVYLP